MTRLVLFGTLLDDELRDIVAGQPVAVTRAHLPGHEVERSAAGDWPVLVPGEGVEIGFTDPLDAEARARFDWYESTFGYLPEPIDVDGTPALVYRAADGATGSGDSWSLDDWMRVHGPRTRLAAREVMRARGQQTAAQMAARRGIVQARAQGIVDVGTTPRQITHGQRMSRDAVDVASVTYPYEGFHRVEEWVIDHPRFDGTRSGQLHRAVSHVADASTVLPYDPVRRRALVVEQFRAGAMSKGDTQPWLLEPVAGLIDAGETPESAALRELQEEAGLTAAPADLRFVGRYYPSPGGLAQILHSYVALCDLPDGADGLHGLEEEGEDIRAHLVPLDALIAMVASGEAANAPLIVSIQWLALNAGLLDAGQGAD